MNILFEEVFMKNLCGYFIFNNEQFIYLEKRI